MMRDISLISLDLAPEGTWEEAAHYWALLFKSGGLSGGSFVFTQMPLKTFSYETLKASHASTKLEFMWKGTFLLSHISASTRTLSHYKDTSVWHLVHYY